MLRPEPSRRKSRLSNASPTPTLVLGSGITVLGAVRGLHRAGIPALVLDDKASLARHSRWWRNAPPLSPRGFQDYLATFPSEKLVVLPCSDHWVREVSALPAELRSKVKVTPVDPTVVETFLDKGLFGAFLDRHGFAHPRTYVSRELPALSDCENLFVKPRDSQRFFQVFGQKAYWPSSVASLEEKLEEMERIGMEVVLQEYVPGPPSNHIFVDGFVDSNGAVRGCFARRRLRMSPPRFGNSSYMVSISPAEAPAAISLVEDILSASGYRGIFSAEIKEDERDGTFKVLEVNIRPWWFVEFAANCGVNVVSMAYRDALGEPVQGVEEYTVGRRLCHPYYDWFACRLESPGFSSATLKWVRSMAGADRPVFRWSDPGPGVSEALRLGKGFVARRLPWGSNR